MPLMYGNAVFKKCCADLGLYLLRKTAQRHGGGMRIRSASGGGGVAELSLRLTSWNHLLKNEFIYK